MVARPYLLSAAVLFASALLFIATGCDKKNDAPAAPINPPTPVADPKPTGTPDLKTLPTEDPYATGSTKAPVGTAGTTGTTGTIPGTGAAPLGGGKVHVMAPHDTLFHLGEVYYGKASKANLDKILAANPQIKDPNHVPVGAKINIP